MEKVEFVTFFGVLGSAITRVGEVKVVWAPFKPLECFRTLN